MNISATSAGSTPPASLQQLQPQTTQGQRVLPLSPQSSNASAAAACSLGMTAQDFANLVKERGLALVSPSSVLCNLVEAKDKNLWSNLHLEKKAILERLNYGVLEWFEHIQEAAKELKLLHKSSVVHGEVTPSNIYLVQTQGSAFRSCLKTYSKAKSLFGCFEEERGFRDPFSVYGFFTPLSDIYGFALTLSWLLDDQNAPTLTRQILEEDSLALMRAVIRGNEVSFNLRASERYPLEHHIRLICYEQMRVLYALMAKEHIDVSCLHRTSGNEGHIKSSIKRAYDAVLSKAGSPQAMHDKIKELTAGVEAEMRQENIRVINIDELLDEANRRLAHLRISSSPVGSGLIKTFSSAASGAQSAASTGVANPEVLAAMRDLAQESEGAETAVRSETQRFVDSEI